MDRAAGAATAYDDGEDDEGEGREDDDEEDDDGGDEDDESEDDESEEDDDDDDDGGEDDPDPYDPDDPDLNPNHSNTYLWPPSLLPLLPDPLAAQVDPSAPGQRSKKYYLSYSYCKQGMRRGQPQRCAGCHLSWNLD